MLQSARTFLIVKSRGCCDVNRLSEGYDYKSFSHCISARCGRLAFVVVALFFMATPSWSDSIGGALEQFTSTFTLFENIFDLKKVKYRSILCGILKPSYTALLCYLYL